MSRQVKMRRPSVAKFVEMYCLVDRRPLELLDHQKEFLNHLDRQGEQVIINKEFETKVVDLGVLPGDPTAYFGRKVGY